MTKAAIIGAGRLGTSLGMALTQHGYAIEALSCRSVSSARESAQIIGSGEPSSDNSHTAGKGDWVFLTVPDDEIEKVAVELAKSPVDWQAKTVFHCSGLLASRVLEPLQSRGARTASLHPIQTFASKRSSPHIFDGITFGCEGQREAMKSARALLRRLGARMLEIKAEDKPLYHAACSLASQPLVVLVHEAVGLFQRLGLTKNRATRSLLPLVQGTLHNIKKLDTSAVLTGPMVRGDVTSVTRHLEALKAFPRVRDAYVRLGLLALDMAQREHKTPLQKIKALRNLLEEK